eukprot:UN20944
MAGCKSDTCSCETSYTGIGFHCAKKLVSDPAPSVGANYRNMNYSDDLKGWNLTRRVVNVLTNWEELRWLRQNRLWETVLV